MLRWTTSESCVPSISSSTICTRRARCSSWGAHVRARYVWLVVHDTSGPQFLPRSTDAVRQLVWASDGRSVRDVVVAGRHVLRDRECITVDVNSLRAEALERRDHLLRARG